LAVATARSQVAAEGGACKEGTAACAKDDFFSANRCVQARSRDAKLLAGDPNVG
jgi:hypothetical protein